MELTRHFSRAGRSPFDDIEWTTVPVAGFAQPVETPKLWSTTATEIAASKYFRRKYENSVRQLLQRVTKAVRQAAEWQGYVKGDQAQIFQDELSAILLNQVASFNSPVYFNVGLFTEYGIMGHGENFITENGKATCLSSAYLRPQASACFIQEVKDDLIGIFELLKSEAKLFKYGSGTGTNFSSLRAKGEALEGGGESTGLISYLEIFDKAAQAIKSGGTTRRAAKMVVLDADHPEVTEFIHWKMMEERKARVLLANGYSGGMEGEAFRTVSGQNSNNSVRVTDEFLNRATQGGAWELKERKSGKTTKEVKAKEIFRQMARAAWECADPGIQYHDTIQAWHMCAESGPIRSSNPCSEYMFLDDSACNLASLNLVAFHKNGNFDWHSFRQATQVLLLAQEVLVDYASYPTAKIAENSHRFRPLGLGYANLGGLLMHMAIPYDSDQAVKTTSQITAAMHAIALDTSQEIARKRGAFAAWKENREGALRVIDKHVHSFQQLNLDMPWVAEIFARAKQGAEGHGLRNAQVTLLAPTGTIGLLMDCDTLGIEPDFSLVKRKTLAGGGELRLVNQSVPAALKKLNYDPTQIQKIVEHVGQTGTILSAPGFNPEHAKIFDCAVPPQGHPERRISPEGHLKIMAAAQPFLSGAISKTVNLPAAATVEDVESIFLQGWTMGLKALAIYRDGSKALQPLCAEC